MGRALALLEAASVVVVTGTRLHHEVLVEGTTHVVVERRLRELLVVEAGLHAGTFRGTLSSRNILPSTFATAEILVFLVGIV